MTETILDTRTDANPRVRKAREAAEAVDACNHLKELVFVERCRAIAEEAKDGKFQLEFTRDELVTLLAAVVGECKRFPGTLDEQGPTLRSKSEVGYLNRLSEVKERLDRVVHPHHYQGK